MWVIRDRIRLVIIILVSIAISIILMCVILLILQCIFRCNAYNFYLMMLLLSTFLLSSLKL